MRVSDFNFDLPDELIARYPKTDRVSCRLLQLNGENGEIFHRTFIYKKNYIELLFFTLPRHHW